MGDPQDVSLYVRCVQQEVRTFKPDNPSDPSPPMTLTDCTMLGQDDMLRVEVVVKNMVKSPFEVGKKYRAVFSPQDSWR